MLRCFVKTPLYYKDEFKSSYVYLYIAGMGADLARAYAILYFCRAPAHINSSRTSVGPNKIINVFVCILPHDEEIVSL